MEAEPFYDKFAPKEWGRLERHQTEFAVSLSHGLGSWSSYEMGPSALLEGTHHHDGINTSR